MTKGAAAHTADKNAGFIETSLLLLAGERSILNDFYIGAKTGTLNFLQKRADRKTGTLNFFQNA
jgi:hypothetical protein